MNTATFFISTGRCGTQWLAHHLNEIYGDLAVVTHEPLYGDYRPREFFRSPDPKRPLADVERLGPHLDWIESVLQEKSYVEVGWPSYGVLPTIIDRFQDRIQLVHLLRHPVSVALSLCTHEYYNPSLRDDAFIHHVQLNPFDAGVVQQDYRDGWNSLSQYEKCLFLWSEIHLYAADLQSSHPEVPFLRVKIESLTDRDSGEFRKLIRFLGLPYRRAVEGIFSKKVDHYQRKASQYPDWRKITDHALTMKLSAEFEYRIEDLNPRRLNARYHRTILEKLKDKISSLKKTAV
jgi:hypothetical protein